VLDFLEEEAHMQGTKGQVSYFCPFFPFEEKPVVGWPSA